MSRSIVDGVMQLVCEQLVLGDCRRVGLVHQFDVDLSAKLVGGLKDTYSIFGRFVAVADRPVGGIIYSGISLILSLTK